MKENNFLQKICYITNSINSTIIIFDNIIYLNKIINNIIQHCWIGYNIKDKGNYNLTFEIFSDKDIINFDFIKTHYPIKFYKIQNITANIWTKININLNILKNHELLCLIFNDFNDIINIQFKNLKCSLNKLPDDFDPIIYNKLNRNLIFLSNEELEIHYLENRNSKNLIYKEDISSIYKNVNNNKINYINSLNNLNLYKNKIYGLWIGNKLSDLHLLCLKSFLKYDNEIILYIYNEIINLPSGIKILDANDIIPYDLVYLYTGSYAGFSDFFRWKLLYLHGGTWIDLDLYCVKPLSNFDQDIFFSYENNIDYQIETNPIKINKNHQLMLDLYSYCFKVIITKYIYENVYKKNEKVHINEIILILKKYDDLNIINYNNITNNFYNFNDLCNILNLDINNKIGQNSWLHFGPILLKKYILIHNMLKYVLDYNYFNIIQYNRINKYIINDTENYYENNNIYIYNLFASMWIKNNMSINNYEPNSLIYKFNKSLKITLHFILATIGRKSIFRMLESLKYQLDENDSITIIFDGKNNLNNYEIIKKYIYNSNTKFICNINIIINEENLGYYGHAIRNKYNDFIEDFIIHIDDDDYISGNVIEHIKNNCLNKNTIYLYKCIWQEGNKITEMWNEPILKLGNIGTPCGIIPNHINKKGYWGLYVGGDFDFYKSICDKYNIIFINEIHYIIRNCYYEDTINNIKINYINKLINKDYINNKNKYNIYLINLENRTDRKDLFINNNNNIISKLFNINLFNAIKNDIGWIGCSLSHLYLVYYAKYNNLPYIIVSEDDTIFSTLDYELINNILLKLTNNLDDWTIYNGNPTFGEVLYNNSIMNVSNSIIDENLINISFGQTTNFIIYNRKSYDKILSYDFSEPIDIYISKNFTQITYKNYITKQYESYSDIESKIVDYTNFILVCNNYLLGLLN